MCELCGKLPAVCGIEIDADIITEVCIDCGGLLARQHKKPLLLLEEDAVAA